jgi:hypothetical protein
MEFVLLVLAILIGMGVHYAIKRDTTDALAVGAALFTVALVPLLAALFNGR